MRLRSSFHLGRIAEKYLIVAAHRAPANSGLLLIAHHKWCHWRTKDEYAKFQFVAAQVCTVSFTDASGIRHGVEVQAESLYEAAVLAVRAFKKAEWIDHIGPAARLEVEVRPAAAKHTITLLQVQRWLDGAVNSPNEMIKKRKLKELLAAP